jgi:hypothetical protein
MTQQAFKIFQPVERDVLIIGFIRDILFDRIEAMVFDHRCHSLLKFGGQSDRIFFKKTLRLFVCKKRFSAQKEELLPAALFENCIN